LFPPRTDGVDPRHCATCGTGRLSLKLGKFGAFIGCSNYPECRFTRPFSVPGADGVEDAATRPLGRDPHGIEVTLRSGRFGPYVQLGEAVEGEKPKRASLLRGTNPADVDLEMALKLLSLPREVGRHPESGEPIIAGVGRFGPYIQHGKTYANIETGDDVFNIGLNRAVTLIAEKVAKGPRGGRFGGDPGRLLGDHPDKGGAVLVKNGRYGPYVTHDGVNATLPSDKTPDAITLEEALALLAARAERTGGKPRRGAKGAKKGAKAGAAEAAKPKKAAAKGKATKTDVAIAPAAAPVKAKKVAPTARAKAKMKAASKPAAKPAPEPAPKRAKAGK
jgi:DNA topoisomerase-1